MLTGQYPVHPIALLVLIQAAGQNNMQEQQLQGRTFLFSTHEKLNVVNLKILVSATLEESVRYVMTRDRAEPAAGLVVQERKDISCEAGKVTVIHHWSIPQLISYSANVLSPAIQPIYVLI